jgi:hypothetical protein
MKKAISIMAIGAILLIVIITLAQVAHYQISMYYSSNVVPDQFENDSAYTQLQYRDSLDHITTIVMYVLCIFTIIWVVNKLRKI